MTQKKILLKLKKEDDANGTNEKMKYEGHVINHKIGHRLYKIIITKDPEFSDKLFQKIEGNIKEYVLGSFSSWVVLSLLENESTSDLVKTSLLDMKNKIETTNLRFKKNLKKKKK